MFGHTSTNKYFPVGSDSKGSAYNAGDPGFNPWVGKISWKRKWQPTSVFLPGKSHGWRYLVGYSPRGHKESDTTEQLHFTQIKTITSHYTRNLKESIYSMRKGHYTEGKVEVQRKEKSVLRCVYEGPVTPGGSW